MLRFNTSRRHFISLHGSGLARRHAWLGAAASVSSLSLASLFRMNVCYSRLGWNLLKIGTDGLSARCGVVHSWLTSRHSSNFSMSPTQENALDGRLKLPQHCATLSKKVFACVTTRWGGLLARTANSLPLLQIRSVDVVGLWAARRHVCGAAVQLVLKEPSRPALAFRASPSWAY